MLLRISASKDTIITNKNVLGSSVVYSNAGASEILQVFKTYNPYQVANSLITFASGGISSMTGSYTGSITWRLVLSNVETENPNAGQFDIEIIPLSQSWNEGKGHDLDYWTDLGNANWISSSVGVTWANAGARPSSSSVSAVAHFDEGHENLDVDVTSMIGQVPYGFLLGISSTLLADPNDYYMKAFRSRQTHFQQYRPYLEARWNDASGSYGSSFVDIVDSSGVLVGGVYDLESVYDRSENPVLHTYFRPRDWNAAVVSTGSTDVTGTILTRAFYRVVDNVSNDVVIPFGTGTSPSSAVFSPTAYTQLSYNDAGNFFMFPMQNLVPGFSYRFEIGYYDINNSWHVTKNDDVTFRVI
jgi:hypothetical protein